MRKVFATVKTNIIEIIKNDDGTNMTVYDLPRFNIFTTQ